MEKDKRKNNDLQNTTQKFKDRMRSDGMEKLDFKSGGRTIAVTWTIEISKKKKKKKIKLRCGKYLGRLSGLLLFFKST